MLVNVLPVPFADAAHQRQYEAVQAALAAEADAPATVLLGNLSAFAPIAADALIVRPNGLALVVLTPHGGHLTIPALAYGAWYLGGQPLPGRAGADNPFDHYRQQLPLVLAWLGEQFDRPVAELPASLGLALFEAPLTFGPEVEGHLHQHAAHDFQLLGEAAQVPVRLHTLSLTSPAALTKDELLDWGDYLVNEPYISYEEGTPENLSTFLEQKLRQLWRWLGAEDIPADPPYGGPTPIDHTRRDQQEQARLEQLRRELQAELHQQRTEATRREAAREQELALLRQQLAQAGQSATERRAEQQTQAALEESLRTTRAELAARTQALDGRIEQLGQLIKQLQAQPTLPPVAQPVQPIQATTARPTGPATRPATRSYRRLRQAERWGLLLLVVAILGTGTVAVLRAVRPVVSRTFTQKPVRESGDSSPEEDAAPAPIIVYDTLTKSSGPRPDTTTTGASSAAEEAPPTPATEPAHADTARAGAAPAPTPTQAADTAATSPQP